VSEENGHAFSVDWAISFKLFYGCVSDETRIQMSQLLTRLNLMSLRLIQYSPLDPWKRRRSFKNYIWPCFQCGLGHQFQAVLGVF
jgi:hypothetical protein